MNLVKGYPRLDQKFAFEGSGDEMVPGWPGYQFPKDIMTLAT